MKREHYQERSFRIFNMKFITAATDKTLSFYKQKKVVLCYDSDSPHLERIVRCMESLSKITNAESLGIEYYAIDYRAYPEKVAAFTEMLPCVLLYLYGIPIMYQGAFNLNDIHLWLKLHTQVCCTMDTQGPSPTPTPTPIEPIPTQLTQQMQTQPSYQDRISLPINNL